MSDRSLTAAARSLLKPDLDARIAAINGLGDAAARVDSAAAAVAAATKQHTDAVAAYDTAYEAALRASWTRTQLSELNLGREYGRLPRTRRRIPTQARTAASPADPSNRRTPTAGIAVEADSTDSCAEATAGSVGHVWPAAAVSDPTAPGAVPGSDRRTSLPEHTTGDVDFTGD